jgi:(1->4)-alpha-D-glucan 1-alpha-D-glucosylmutase
MQALFTGDVNALTHHLGALAAHHRHARDIPLSELMEVLIEVSACLPVYRTYVHNEAVSGRDRALIEEIVALARRRTPPDKIGDPAFDFIRSVLLLEPPPYLADRKPEWARFVMRWQQFTGPLLAKGLEDTATYRHNSLLSLNEVGSDPLREDPAFDIVEFHEFNRRRLEQWPATMNATATHDTKRGEDMRARLNVLTEIPAEWEERLDRWTRWNQDKRVPVGGVLAPSVSEEILIYQTLIGAWPHREEDEPAFAGRVAEFLVKALREAKQSTSWISPRQDYELAVQQFFEAILAGPSPFLDDLLEFRKRIEGAGARNSLGQLLLKIASPGVPDFYQGTEFWNFSLVDPDNRRPVDFERRTALLENLRRREADDRVALVRDLASNLLRDEVKLFVTCRALGFRKANRELFARGDYVPLDVRGPCANHICAFARRRREQWVVVVVPRWTCAAEAWGDTEIVLPADAPAEWTDAITGLIPVSWRVADVLAEFPVALLSN